MRGLAAFHLTFREIEKAEENFEFGKHVLHYASTLQLCKEIVIVLRISAFLPCVSREAFR